MPRIRFLLRWQILAGFGVLLAIILLLGAVARYQTERLWDATRTMHDHPMQVRDSAHHMVRAVLNIRQATRDLVLNPDPESEKLAQEAIEREEPALEQALATFQARYLGPPADLERVRRHLRDWSSARGRVLDLLHQGRTEDAVQLLKPHTGEAFVAAERLLLAIGVIETFAASKGATLRKNAEDTYNQLHFQMVLILSLVLILALITILVVLRNFRRSLDGLLTATHAFSETTPVHAPVPPNEFGELAVQYNHLTDRVTAELNRRRNATELNRIFVGEADPGACARSVLTSIMTFSGATTGALLLPDKSTGLLVPQATGGLEPDAVKPIDPASVAGDFGLARAAGGFLHLADLPPSGPHVLPTMHGLVFPRELVTLVPEIDGRPLAVVTIGTLRAFDPELCAHLRTLLEPLATGLGALLARQRLRETSEELRSKNTELELQAAELDSQNMELELQAMQLQEMNRVKTAFFSNMSHELRTPLNSVIALSGVLSRRLAATIPAEERGYLDIIERNGRQLLTLINDVLDLARLESGREELRPAEFDAAEAARETAGLLAPLAAEKGLTLHVEAAEAIRIVSDRAKLVHILQNLLGNAIKFTAAGSVTLTVRQQPDHLVVTVADTGIGIPADQLERIFEEFRQVDNSMSRAHQGSGLGLAIARRYAHLLGGTLTASSTPGAGSTFELRLPRDHRGTDEPVGDMEYFGPTGHGGNRVLLVEDNEAAVIQIRDLLSPPAFSLRVARDGQAGLAAIREELPDAIILDLNMPGVDGFETLRALREEPATAHTPVLILTARHVSKDELSFLKDNGIFQLIQKGAIRRDDLLQLIRRMLGKPAAGGHA